MDSEVPSMQLLSGVMSSATNSFYDSDHSFLSSLQSPFHSSDDAEQHQSIDLNDDNDTDKGRDLDAECAELSDAAIKVSDDNSDTYTPDRSSWSLVTKHTVKGCL